MATADEYRTYAHECLKWASESETEEQQSLFLGLARSWTCAALRIEGVMVVIEKNPASEATRAGWAEGESEGVNSTLSWRRRQV
jgi:hypothetical protein